jgi:hypothetical protein
VTSGGASAGGSFLRVCVVREGAGVGEMRVGGELGAPFIGGEGRGGGATKLVGEGSVTGDH